MCYTHLCIEIPNPLRCEELAETDAILYCHKELDKVSLVVLYGCHHEIIQY